MTKFSVINCKLRSTPVRAKTQLSGHDGDLLSDVTGYRQLVGSLKYLTFTRPHIAYVDQRVAQFMSHPPPPHLFATKQILRYLKDNVDFGLFFR